MARLITDGFETQKFSAAGATDPEGLNTGINGAPTISTTTVRSGAGSFLCAADARYKLYPVTGAFDRGYYFRTYFQKSANTAIATNIIKFEDSGFATQVAVLFNTNGTLALQDSAFSNLAVSAALTSNVWYRVEVLLQVSAAGVDTYEFRIDGTTVGSGTSALSANVPAFVLMGCSGGAPSANLLFDDVALNDATGANQNFWPGAGKIVLLKPISDNANTGMTGGAGGTTSLFDAVNNTPPIGVISPGTNLTEIGSATSNTTDNFRPNLGAYTTAVASGGGGMAASDIPVLVQTLGRGGNSTTTTRNFGIQGISNPAIAEVTQATGATAAGTEVVGWTTVRSAVAYNPTITPGTSPVLQFRKATASTDRILCELMGMYVEYVPRTGIPKRRVPATGLAEVNSGARYR